MKCLILSKTAAVTFFWQEEHLSEALSGYIRPGYILASLTRFYIFDILSEKLLIHAYEIECYNTPALSRRSRTSREYRYKRLYSLWFGFGLVLLCIRTAFWGLSWLRFWFLFLGISSDSARGFCWFRVCRLSWFLCYFDWILWFISFLFLRFTPANMSTCYNPLRIYVKLTLKLRADNSRNVCYHAVQKLLLTHSIEN